MLILSGGGIFHKCSGRMSFTRSDLGLRPHPFMSRPILSQTSFYDRILLNFLPRPISTTITLENAGAFLSYTPSLHTMRRLSLGLREYAHYRFGAQGE